MARQQHAQDRNHWDVHLAKSFVDDEENLIDPIDVTDRLNTRFVVRRFDTGTKLATMPLSPISALTAYLFATRPCSVFNDRIPRNDAVPYPGSRNYLTRGAACRGHGQGMSSLI